MLRVLQVKFFPAGQQVGAVFNLVHQVVEQFADLFGVFCGEAPDIVEQAGNVVAVHAAEV